MILAPSEIHFLKDSSNKLMFQDSETLVNELSHRFQEGGEKIPKVQVASKSGCWFALNNSSLHILRDLESQGKCPRVHVEVVPLSKVPESVQKGMVVSTEEDLNANKGCQEKRPSKEQKPCQESEKEYCRISAECLANTALLDALASDTDGSSSYSGSDYSDYDDNDDDEDDGEDTDSEYDDTLMCNVCDRGFMTTRELTRHQQKRRHFGCSVCSSNFRNLLSLEQHKESLDHWSEDDGNTYDSDSFSESDEARKDPEDQEGKVEETPTDERDQDNVPEELQKLL